MTIIKQDTKDSRIKKNVTKRNKYAEFLFQHVFKSEFQIEDRVSYWNCLYIFAILIYSVLISSSWLLAPMHDTIKYPQYWYEVMCLYSIMTPIILIPMLYQDYSFVFKMPSLITLGATFRLFLALALGFVVPYFLCYLLWTIILDYNHPMPFIALCAYPMTITYNIVIWFEFPVDLRRDKIFRKRIQAYMLTFIWAMLEHLVYAGLAILFVSLSSDMQWILAIIMPILRDLNIRVRRKLLNRYAGDEKRMATIKVDCFIGICYSTFIAINLAPASEITLLSVLAVEFLLNLSLTWKICRLQRKINSNSEDQDSLKEEIRNNIHSLVLNATIMLIVPLAYFVTFFIAYYGPNATILGNVRNSYWDYKEIEDVGKLVKAGMEMFSIDFTSYIICRIILWIFCKINLFQEYCKLIKQCWAVIAIELGGYICQVKLLAKDKLNHTAVKI